MEFFRDTHYDFLGKKWPFIIASLVLTVAGLISLAIKGGPNYGIDFRGGTVITVKFRGEPPVDKIRAALRGKFSSDPTVQNYIGGSNEVSIGTAGSQSDSKVVLQTLQEVFGLKSGGKLDFNNASAVALADRLRIPLQNAGASLSDDQLKKLTEDLRKFRDSSANSGLISNFSQLSGVPGVTPQVLSVLQQECYPGSFTLRGIDVVGPKVGGDLRKQALTATLLALGGMLVYIAFRFEWIYGVAAVIATFHDTIITIGFFSLFNKELDLTVIAALLTLVGYSMNDTIVIFDRIRENLRLGVRESLTDTINRSVNQTLARTVMTSGLTFLTAISLFLFGGPVLHGFSFALVVGILIGTYSSVFVASPVLVFWQNWSDKRRKSAPSSVKPSAPSRVTAGKSPVKAIK